MVGPTPRRIERSCDELRLPPPKQFRDEPLPPEPFRDPPRQHSVDNLLYHVYEGVKELRRREVAELRERRTRRRRLPRRPQPTSDEGFDEIEPCRDSDTSTVESVNVRDIFRTRHPFQGYLFKEDVETLKRTFETDAEKRIATSPKNTNSAITKEMSKTFPEKDDKEDKAEDKEGLKGTQERLDCGCYDDRVKLRRIQDATLTFIKAKEEFKRQINFTGMIYRYVIYLITA